MFELKQPTLIVIDKKKLYDTLPPFLSTFKNTYFDILQRMLYDKVYDWDVLICPC